MVKRPWWIAVFLVSAVCPAQVTGEFAMDKSVYAVGEPVFLNLTLTNQSAEPQKVTTHDPNSPCSAYAIEISRLQSPRVACFRAYGASCGSGWITLAPHQSITERVLLNYPRQFEGDLNPPVKLPGDYTIDARRSISYAPAEAEEFTNPERTDVQTVFTLRVDAALTADPSVWAPFVKQLGSQDAALRREAALTLATLAPPALEPLLLTFAHAQDAEIKQFAPLALSNLSTEASLSALAELLVDNPAGSYEANAAAEALGKTHDIKWLPFLLAFADENGAMYLPAAAASGGEAALPALEARLRSTDPQVRNGAIYALGSTGSRAAIPLLIGLLRAPTGSGDSLQYMAATASGSLQQLTHRYIERTSTDSPDGAWRHWQQWWLNAGQNAPVYQPDECVEDTSLP